MAKFILYAIAAIFFAASVGCLALWGWSWRSPEAYYGPSMALRHRAAYLEFFDGYALAMLMPAGESQAYLAQWERFSLEGENRLHSSVHVYKLHGPLVVRANAVSFPLWWGSLVFALAGVGVLRFRRQFSIRSALIGLAVVAALLGMAVAL